MTGAYDGKLYQGEAYAFPVFGTVVKDDMTAADFYRCGAPMDRTYEQYEEAFGLPLEVFMGRRILDLGAGVRATFAAQAADHGIDVISVCPNWADTNYRSDLHNNSVWQGDGKSIAALSQQQPFRDESFDAVISFWGGCRHTCQELNLPMHKHSAK